MSDRIFNTLTGAFIAPDATPSNTAVTIRQNTETLLLGCHLPHVGFYKYNLLVDPDRQYPIGITYATDTPEPDQGIVSKKMKCNPKGAFSYCHKVDNLSDNSTDLDIDIALNAELSIQLLIQEYFRLIANDPRYSNLFSDSQLVDIREGLIQWIASGSDSMPGSLAQLISPFFDRTNVPYSIDPPTTQADGSCGSDSAEVDFVQLTAVLNARFNIMLKLKLKLGLGTASSKESRGVVKQEVSISWDFCNAPNIKGCCGNK
jgi:hypothetical protein